MKRNEAEKNDDRYYLSPGNPLALKSAQTISFLRAAAEHCLNLSANRARLPCLGSSVEIDVNASSRVVRSEHLLEFLFDRSALLKFRMAEMTKVYFSRIDSSVVGPLLLAATENGLRCVQFYKAKLPAPARTKFGLNRVIISALMYRSWKPIFAVNCANSPASST